MSDVSGNTFDRISEIACRIAEERDEAIERWKDMLHKYSLMLDERDEARRWARLWKRVAKTNREAFYIAEDETQEARRWARRGWRERDMWCGVASDQARKIYHLETEVAKIREELRAALFALGHSVIGGKPEIVHKNFAADDAYHFVRQLQAENAALRRELEALKKPIGVWDDEITRSAYEQDADDQ